LKKHALLSASSAKQWLTCTPSPRLCENEEEHKSKYADEGTKAHELCEKLVNSFINQDGKQHECDDSEMYECCLEWLSLVEECTAALETSQKRKAKVFTEIKLDYSNYAPEGFGTCDCLICCGKAIHVLDFKYGRGIPVPVEHNPQLRCYAIGALNLFEGIAEIEQIKMTICQPRKNYCETTTETVEEILDWAENELKPKAEMAFKGEGELVPGDHCVFCRVRAKCRARYEYVTSAISDDFDEPQTLSDEEIEQIIPKLDDIEDWVDDVRKYVLSRTLNGHKWKSVKCVEGRSCRQISSAAADELRKQGYNDDQIFNHKIKGLGELATLLGGDDALNAVLGKYITKPKGKPTIVPRVGNERRQELEFSDVAEHFN